MPSRLAKVKVLDRGDYTTVDGSAEQKLATPEVMQPKIDEVVAKYKGGRCFVRASGTENVVRVYCEAQESLDVDDMMYKVIGLIQLITPDKFAP